MTIRLGYLLPAWLTALLLAGCSKAPAPAGAASEATWRANAEVREQLPFGDTKDFDDARRGFLAPVAEPELSTAGGQPAWDLGAFDFINEAEQAPPSVNPSLWRQARLNNIAGLFEVTDGIYQVRGYDLSNISFVAGKTGWIVIDPLISAENAAAALALANHHLGERPVRAVIYTHSHADHFAGVKGVAGQGDVDAGRVKIIAPEGFVEAAVSENVFAGNAMARRATYMYGSLLPRSATGHVDAGLGKATSSGTLTMIAPTDVIGATGTTMIVDGVTMEFQYTPDTEAPAEMNVFFPASRALCMAENVSHTLHNLYTLRGAEVRDAVSWSRALDESLKLYGDRAEVVFTGHHWPRWGPAGIREYLENQRDLYKYIHDQTLRLANQGYTAQEIAEDLELPPDLAQNWASRSYYGTLKHNVKAVYQKYLGWFDGNPAHLDPLPRSEAAARYVDFMGGADAVLEKAQAAYQAGDYRWVAEVVNHLVFADPGNDAARALQADALEQLGFQAESGPWRSFYLSGAKELRDGIREAPAPRPGPDIIASLTPEMLFDTLAVRLNGPESADEDLLINVDFFDLERQYSLVVRNGVLHHRPGLADNADATLRVRRAMLNELAAGQVSVLDAVTGDDVSVDGSLTAVARFFLLLDRFDFWFPVVTP